MHLDEFIRRHSVSGHLEGEIILVPQFLRDAVAQIPQLHQAGLQGRAGFLRRFPDFAPLGQIGALVELVVDLVRRDRFSVELELEAVEGGGLFGLGFDASRHQVRIRHRSFGGVAQDLVELTEGQLVQFRAMSEQLLRFVDDRGVAIKSGGRLARCLRRRIVRRGDIGHGKPLRFAADADEALVTGVNEREEAVRSFLDRRRGGGNSSGQNKNAKRLFYRQRWVMHGRKVICPHHIVKRSFFGGPSAPDDKQRAARLAKEKRAVGKPPLLVITL